MSSNLVCNHTQTPARTPVTPLSDFVDHSYDYRHSVLLPLLIVSVAKCLNLIGS